MPACRNLFLAVVLLTAAFCLGCQTTPTEGDTPTPLIEGGHIVEWLVLGPFPNPATEDALPDGATRAGYGTDYLAALGGESAAALQPDTPVSYVDSAGAAQAVTAKTVAAGEKNVVDLAKAYSEAPEQVAYAYAEVTAPRDMEALCFFGSDDWAKVWVNGELVHAIWEGDGRGVTPRQEHFPAPLVRGTNRVLVKIEQNAGPWGFIVELLSPEEAGPILAETERRETILAFQRSGVAPKQKSEHCFPPGDFPEISWQRPDLAEELYGDLPLTVRWFDADMNEVAEAEDPGRYALYAEATAADGKKLRYAHTFYCRPAAWQPWWMPYEVAAPYIGNPAIQEAVWDEHEKAVKIHAGRAIMDSFFQSDDGAILLAGLSEVDSLGHEPTQLDSPHMRHQDYHLRLKLHVLGACGPYPPLAPPRTDSGRNATVLRPGTPAQAGFADDAAAQVRKVCQDWNALEGQPLSVLVARRGYVVLHEAYGEDGEGTATIGTKFPLASLTKCHAGLMLAQFLDQGILELDDPVGLYLPDYPTEGEKVITLRQCMAHTTGFDGHGAFGGMNNPWLDNALVQGLEVLTPGKTFLYNGMGFDLAGKVMEVVSGKSFFRLMHENFFIPLGQDDPTMVDLGYGIDCTVMDLARVGQLMLNKGAYGNVEFYSEATYENVIRPRPIEDFFPEVDSQGEFQYNLGLHVLADTRKDEDPEDDVPAERLFSDNSLGHGAASGAILRVDLDKELIIAVSRNTPGKDYGEHTTRLLTTVVDAMR